MVLLEKINTKLSLAVLPKDAFAPTEAIKGDFSLAVNDYGKTPFKNNLGYFLFTDLPSETYTIKAEGAYYFSKVVTGVTGLDPLKPVVEFEIEPNASYPFPEDATLLKGTVTTNTGAAISNATVAIEGSTRSVLTDDNGKFIFYFKDVVGDEVSVTLNIAQPGYIAKTVSYTVNNGSRKIVSIILLTA